jgi:hypothetical protein
MRLYPSAWRERYEREFEALLQERPIRWHESVDVLVGAIDAHLHPELLGATPKPWTHRLPGLLATSAGLIWTWFFARLLTLGPGDEWGESIGLAVLLMLCAVPGDYTLPYLRRIGMTIGAIVIAMVVGRAAPWSATGGVLNLVAGATAWLLVGAGMLSLAAIRAGIGSRGRWILLAAVGLVPAIVAVPVMGGFGPTDRGGVAAMVVAILPYGVAWAMIGLRMTFRGSVTMYDAPPTESTTEVLAT